MHEIGTGESDQFLADLARVVLARPAVGNAHDVEVRAQVALRPVIPPHSRADGAEAGPHDKSGCGRRAVVSMSSVSSPTNPSGMVSENADPAGREDGTVALGEAGLEKK